MFDSNHPPLICLDSMIQWALRCQDNAHFILHKINRKSWLKEFCTIRFCLPRRSGHTTTALFLAKKYFSNPIFIVPYLKCAEPYKGEKVYSFKNFTAQLGKDEIDSVFIDMSSFMSTTAQEQIYELNFNLDKKNLIAFVQ